MRETSEQEQAWARDLARLVIQKHLPTLDTARIKAVLCALFGHPPVVTGDSFDNYRCARCSAVLFAANRLPGEYAVVAHLSSAGGCSTCPDIVAALTNEQRLLTILHPEEVQPRRVRPRPRRARQEETP